MTAPTLPTSGTRPRNEEVVYVMYSKHALLDKVRPVLTGIWNSVGFIHFRDALDTGSSKHNLLLLYDASPERLWLSTLLMRVSSILFISKCNIQCTGSCLIHVHRGRRTEKLIQRLYSTLIIYTVQQKLMMGVKWRNLSIYHQKRGKEIPSWT
jgi:hypothetical protein